MVFLQTTTRTGRFIDGKERRFEGEWREEDVLV